MRFPFSRIQGGGVLPPRPQSKQVLLSFLGGAIGIMVIAYLTQQFGLPLMMAPFGATCALLFAAPDSPLAQPRSVIGGHFISSLVGVVIAKYVGAGPVEMGLAVGLAIALMHASRTLHAPAGADPLVILLAGEASWSYLFVPSLLGSIVLVVIAVVINNVGHEKAWPKYWY
ncbi:HPP family protein [Alcaligenes aquatilis]|uniref:HPP family protein n=1 Tax=Alcaligenes aquatilis TaxID=323284 RepID=UPI00361D9680